MATRDVRFVPAPLLAAVDVLALLSFVVLGMRSHDSSGAVEVFLRNAVPLIVAWFGAGALLRCYREPSLRTLLRTWAVAVPLAVVARSVWVGSPTGVRFLTFLAVSLAVTLVLLLLGRGVAAALARR